LLQRTLCCWLLFISATQAAFEIQNAAPTSVARGGNISISADGSNPAAPVGNQGFSSFLSYSNLYGIKNLRIWNCDLRYTHQSRFGLGLRFSALGNPTYQEKTLGFSLGRLVLPLIAAGISINYYDLTISDYRHSGSFGLNCGVKFFPDTTINFALYFENVDAPKICDGRESLPQAFAFGWHWQPVRRGDLTGEIYKDTQRPFTFRSGIRIEIIRGCNLLGGIQFNPDRVTGGLEIKWHKIRMAWAVQHHVALPLTFYYGCGINL